MKNKNVYFFYFILGSLLPLFGAVSLKSKIFVLLVLLIASIISNRSIKIILFFKFFFVLISVDYIFDLLFLFNEEIFSFSDQKFLLTTFEYLSFLVLLTPFFIKKDTDNNFISGALVSLSILSVIFLLDQKFNLHLFQVSNFWKSQGREAIFFSDPNAFGVFFALIFPFYLSKIFDSNKLPRCTFFIVLTAVSFIAATYSGSRTMIIGIVVSTICFFLFKFKAKKKFIILSLIVIAIVFSAVTYNSSSLCRYFHQSANRICKSLDLNQLTKSLYSRSVFTKLNFALIKDYPYTGVGLNQFEKKLPLYKEKLNINIGNWSDNPNNFYLGIVSELGIIGFLFFLLGLLHLRFNLESSNIAIAKKSAVIAILVMLLTGPHFNFVEITIFGTWLISTSVTSKKTSVLISILSILLIIQYLILKIPLYSEREFGLYAFEHNEYGDFQWTRKKFKKLIKCSNGKLYYTFRSTNPDISDNPLKLSYEINGEKRELIFNNTEPNRLINICTEDSYIRGRLSRDFKPSEVLDVKDDRNLGVQLYNN